LCSLHLCPIMHTHHDTSSCFMHHVMTLHHHDTSSSMMKDDTSSCFTGDWPWYSIYSRNFCHRACSSNLVSFGVDYYCTIFERSAGNTVLDTLPPSIYYLLKNSQAVKKWCSFKKPKLLDQRWWPIVAAMMLMIMNFNNNATVICIVKIYY